MSKDMMNDLFEMAKTEEGRAQLIAVFTELKEEFAPALSLLKETVGTDLDDLIDTSIKYTAKKRRVAFEAYVFEGFSEGQAMQLMVNTSSPITDTLSSMSKLAKSE